MKSIQRSTRPQPQFISNKAAPALRKTSAPSATDSEARVGGDQFANVRSRHFSAQTGQKTTASAWARETSERIFQNVVGNWEQRREYDNFNWDGRNKVLDRMIQELVDQLTRKLEKGQIRHEQLEVELRRGVAEINRRLDRSFGPLPKNPDEPPKPKNPYNYLGRWQAAKKLTEPIAERIVQMIEQGRPQSEIDAYTKKALGQVEQQLDERFGKQPTIRNPGQVPGYPYEARDAALNEAMKPVAEKIIEMAMRGASEAEIDKYVKDKIREINKKLDARFGKLPDPPPYDPAQDTREAYLQHVHHASSQVQILQAQGASKARIQAYIMKRAAEIDQMFPKQGMRAEAEAWWKTVALQMQKRGASSEEIQAYLRKKAAEWRDPTPDEIQAFIARKRQQAEMLAQIAQGIGGKGQKPNLFGIPSYDPFGLADFKMGQF